MGREINETVEDVDEEDEDEDEECVALRSTPACHAAPRAQPRAPGCRFDFPADADADAWEDPSPDGVLGAGSAQQATHAQPQPCSRGFRAGTLFEACVSHDSATVLPLLPRAGEFINTLGPEGDTLLHTAALYGYTDLVEALLAAGADPAVKDENSSTPLVRVARGGSA